MNKLILSFFLISNILFAFKIEADKKKHFIYSFYISSLSGFVYKNYIEKKYKYQYIYIPDNSLSFNFFRLREEQKKRKYQVIKPLIFNKNFKIKQFLFSFGPTMFVGVAKEIYDKNKKGDYFSKGDLIADALGGLVGSLFTLYLKF